MGLFRGPLSELKLVCTFQEDASPGSSTAGVVAGINVAELQRAITAGEAHELFSFELGLC